jgi:hypothetical protein
VALTNTGLVKQVLDRSHAYCYDRGNGQYTPLIPADLLPFAVLGTVPRLQQGSDGMIVLPAPRGQPDGVLSGIHLLANAQWRVRPHHTYLHRSQTLVSEAEC